MIPADVDPTLCAAEPAPETLADGFSPPAVEDEVVPADTVEGMPRAGAGRQEPVLT